MGTEAQPHTTSVVNDYQRCLSWLAACTCGWQERHLLSYTADRALEEHKRHCQVGLLRRQAG